MSKKVELLTEKIFHGVASLSINKKRDYYRHVHSDVALSTNERWQMLGARLRKSADKVVKHYFSEHIFT